MAEKKVFSGEKFDLFKSTVLLNLSSMKKGVFLTFEGIDGSGKTTQVNKFIQRLKLEGILFLLLREPGGTKIGEKIRDILLDKDNMEIFPVAELLLYSASRYQLTKQLVIPALESGKVVVCDRFYDSTTTYQGYARGIDLSFIEQLNLFVTESTKPDLTFILDVPLSERNRRVEKKDLDRLEQESIDFQKKVREGFFSIAKKEPNRVILIDGTQEIDTISKQIWDHFLQKKSTIR
jgi:dTMP kinase